MNSKIVKFVAGAGKTTYSKQILAKNKNGLYLAFNNSVVDEISELGFLSKTIDSLLQSFIIPKFTSQIPIIAPDSIIEWLDLSKLNDWRKGVGNIHIESNGSILYGKKDTGFSLNTNNSLLYESGEKYVSILRLIFCKNKLMLTDSLRSEMAMYLVKNYGKFIIEFLRKRFSYIIVDEAQDLKGSNEELIKLLFNSEMEVTILGDDNQNINNGGKWFESLKADEIKSKTFRCPEENCAWIRENLKIDIHGLTNGGSITHIQFGDVLRLDNRNRILLYNAKQGKDIKEISDKWEGPQFTIKSVKGQTLDKEIVIIGTTLNKKALYTAITRTRKKAYITVKKWS